MERENETIQASSQAALELKSKDIYCPSPPVSIRENPLEGSLAHWVSLTCLVRLFPTGGNKHTQNHGLGA